jgi:tryptophan 7-halogenase
MKRILVVGGGTAGWLSASILARRLTNDGPDSIKVTLVESAEVATIGVGEGTFPTILETLKYLGVNEYDFVRKCSATFKQAIKFCNWEYSPVQGANHYYHLFDVPFKIPNMELPEAWLRKFNGDTAYAYSVAGQAAVCDAGLGPKKLNSPAFSGLTKYAYHLDAGRFASFLRDHAVTSLGVEHIQAHVRSVVKDEAGFISAVATGEQGDLQADFFVDCTGFASLLLGQALQVPFIDKSSVLFVNHAVAMQVPYEREDQAIACHTISTAHQAGWTWDIGLQERRGIGYVYSAAHTSHEQAEQTLRDYIGPAAADLSARRLEMRIGYRENLWQKNCVAIGLSGGFMEPLEATAIAMVETSAILLAAQFPRSRDAMPALAKKFNDIFRFRWERIVDFIKLHYCLSKRSDNDFWLDNRRLESIPESLRQKLELWKNVRPSENDFPNRMDMFALASYEYILYGLNFQVGMQADMGSGLQAEQARRAFGLLRQRVAQALAELPNHRTLVTAIQQREL